MISSMYENRFFWTKIVILKYKIVLLNDTICVNSLICVLKIEPKLSKLVPCMVYLNK